MSTWWSIVGAVSAIAVVVALKSDWAQAQLAQLFDANPKPVVVSQAGKPGAGGLVPADGRPAPPPAPRMAPLPGPSTPLVLPATRAASLKPPTAAPTGQFRLVVEADAKTGQLSQARALLFRSGALQGIIGDLNRSLLLPRDIPVQLQRCGFTNAFYSPSKQSITICDEWVELMADLFGGDKSGDGFVRAIVSATSFVFAHEIGHALVHQYRLPISGREEDVADQFGVYLLAGSVVGDRQVLTAADTFGRMAARHKPITWDNHSLDEQRRYNIQCWVYGSDTARYQLLVDSGLLPERRAASCRDEFAKMVYALDVMLKPHLR